MRIAALDLGSNSFHLLVADAHPDGTFEPLVAEKEILRLADIVTTEGRIGDEAASHAVEVVARFRALAESVGAEEIVACATSAFRDADDSATVVDRIEGEAGVRVNVISGKEEARLIFAAVRASVHIDPGPALALDLGGGSLELMVGDQGGMAWSTSVKLGVARLTAELVRGDPPTDGDRRRLTRRLTSVLAPVADEVASLDPRMLIGSSGTLNALVRMAAARRSGAEPASVNQLTARRKDLLAITEDMFRLTAAERQRLPGVDARRADLLPAGSLLVATVMELSGLDELTGCEWALREGIVLDAIGHHSQGDWSGEPRTLRRESVLNLGRRCNWQEQHARQVARLAVDLFDGLTEVHGLGPHDRELLELGAQLHDIGEHVSVEGHDKHTAYLIQHGRLRGFAPDEVAVLASLGRFHRRGNPKLSFEPFGSLPPARRERVTRLIALLRIADGLDRNHASMVETLDVKVEDGRVRLLVQADGDIDLELWGLRRKRELFERVFDRSLEVEVGGT
ncbi:MAG: Ppx/GppA family phosphatase [Actinomycetota bacterium]|nr:Ppx/GppA family phosphatase [Actinomycetota bacterium]